MATALALIAAAIFAVSTVLQQKGGLKAPPLSLRHPGSFVHLAGQGTWLIGVAILIPGWILLSLRSLSRSQRSGNVGQRRPKRTARRGERVVRRWGRGCVG
jgi:hypothetical protein